MFIFTLMEILQSAVGAVPFSSNFILCAIFHIIGRCGLLSTKVCLSLGGNAAWQDCLRQGACCVVPGDAFKGVSFRNPAARGAGTYRISLKQRA